MSDQQPVLKASKLTKRYGRVVALDNADLELYPGEVLGIIGDNGAGKSTLIKAISGAVRPDSGQIWLNGNEVHFNSPIQARDAGIETVYQNLALSPALSITDNLFLGRELHRPGMLGKWFRKLDHGAMEKQAREKLSELGLLTIQNINQSVETLSGGQRQGVAVARAAALVFPSYSYLTICRMYSRWPTEFMCTGWVNVYALSTLRYTACRMR